MNSPDFKPLPTLGGSIADRLARSQVARDVSERVKQDKIDAESKPLRIVWRPKG